MISSHKKKTTTSILAVCLGLAMVSCGILSMFNQVMATGVVLRNPKAGVEKAYMKDAFDPEYSQGAVFRNSRVSLPGITGEYSMEFVGESTCEEPEPVLLSSSSDNSGSEEDVEAVCGTNTAKDLNTYLITRNGAIYNGEYLDVKEYLWTDVGNWERKIDARSFVASGNNHGEIQQTTPVNVYRELHFYKAGTDQEVSFKGIISMSDFDWGEGYTIEQGYHQAYVNSPTYLMDYNPEDPTTWISQGDADDPFVLSGQISLWAEVESTPEKPLTIVFHSPVAHRESNTVTYYSIITYDVSGDLPEGFEGVPFNAVATNGSLELPVITPDDSEYSFKGWYYDEELTNEAGSMIQVKSDLVLYGKFEKTKDASVTTTIKNGIITESKNDIANYSSYKVQYSCNNGYELASVAIDGVMVSLADYEKEFGFEKITGDHTVDVVCKAVDKASVATSIKNGTITESNYEITVGTDYEVKYTCDKGAKLSTVKVDDKEVDIKKHQESYLFSAIEGKHVVDVTCDIEEKDEDETPSAPNTGASTGNIDAAGIVTISTFGILAIAIFIRMLPRFTHKKLGFDR